MKKLYLRNKLSAQTLRLLLVILSILVLSQTCLAEVGLEEEIHKLKEERISFTLGIGTSNLGLYSSFKTGILAKDGFGYPKGEIDLSWWGDSLFGLGYTWTFELPSGTEIEKTARATIEKQQGRNLQSSELSELVRKELNKDRLSYITVGLLGSIPPIWLTLLSFEFGWMWLVENNVRIKLGLGWPTVLGCDLHFDL
jgi:hypothetical protein